MSLKLQGVPDEPDETCPYIDDVLTDMKKVADIDWYDLGKTMEIIRKANSDLRERMSHFEDETDILGDQLDKANARIEQLERDLAEAQKEIAAHGVTT